MSITTQQPEEREPHRSVIVADGTMGLGSTITSLLSNHPLPVMVIDSTGKIAFVNSAVAKLLGWTVVEFIGLDLSQFCKATAEATILAALSQSLESFTKPGKAFCKDGSVLDVIYQTSGFIDDQTGAYWSMISIKDQTEVSRLHRLLGETNRLAKVGSWELDIKSGVLFWSDVTREIHEVPYDFIPTVDNAINFYMEGEHRNRIIECVNIGIETGKPWDEDFLIVTARGNQKWVRAKGSAVYDGHGKVARIYGAFQDIQDQKLKDLELKTSHDQLTDLLDNSHDMICTFDVEGHFVSVYRPESGCVKTIER